MGDMIALIGLYGVAWAMVVAARKMERIVVALINSNRQPIIHNEPKEVEDAE